MLFKNLLLLAVFLLMASSLYYFEFSLADERDEAKRKQRLLLPFEVKNVVSFTLASRPNKGKKAGKGNDAPESVTIERRDSDWMITSPVQDMASRADVERLLGKLSLLEESSLVAAGAENLDEYGLSRPRAEISLSLAGKDEKIGLLMGDRNPVGYRTYVKKRGYPAVYLVNAGVEAYLLRRCPDLRNRMLFARAFETKDIQRITIVHGTSANPLELEKDASIWRLTRPFEGPANQKAVGLLAKSFRELRADFFITEDAGDGLDFGLDKASLTVTAHVKSAKGPEREFIVFFGKRASGDAPGDPSRHLNGFYASTNLRGTVYVLPDYQHYKLAKTVHQLYDHRMLPEFRPENVKTLRLAWADGERAELVNRQGKWCLKDDTGFPCDQQVISSILNRLSGLSSKGFAAFRPKNLERWKLDRPSLSISFTLRSEKTPLPSRTGGQSFVESADATGKTSAPAPGLQFRLDLAYPDKPAPVAAIVSGSTTVFSLDKNIRENMPACKTSLRDCRLLSYLAHIKDSLTSISLKAKGLSAVRIRRLTHKGEKHWFISDGDCRKIVETALVHWLDSLSRLKTYRVAVPAPEKFTSLARLAFTADGTDDEMWMELGEQAEEPDFFYARFSGIDAVFIIRKRFARLLLAPEFIIDPTKARDGAAAASGGAYNPTKEELETLPRAVIDTEKGSIELLLFEKDAPNTVANFISLAERGFYNGISFHRVEKFCVQAGCPLTKDDDPANDGTGGPGYTIDDEINAERRHLRGVISMANKGPDTAGSQFFITKKAAAWLDGRHTVFGTVLDGMSTINSIEKGTIIDRIRIVRKAQHPYRPKTHPLPGDTTPR